VVTATEVRDGYRELRVTYPDADGQPIPAFLLVPDGDGPFPAAVVLHQHNGERHLGKSEVVGHLGDPHQALGARLVARGVVVLAPDARHFEDRRTGVTGTEPHRNDWLQHYNGLAHALVRGDTLARAVLDDCLRAVSVLSQVRSASRATLGVVGHSFGGSCALFLAALDPRVRWCVASGAACTYRHKLAHGTGLEMALVIPGIADLLDIDDVVGLLSPRPTLLVSAERDPYSADAPAIVARCEARGFGRLRHLRYPGGHALDAQRTDDIVAWLATLLQLGA
ncbi:MAG: dienelactone hydrolase family protein, partial [Myxococcota bacterium]